MSRGKSSRPRGIWQREISGVVEGFPRFERLPEFYAELAKVTLDVEKTKEALKTLNLFTRKTGELAKNYADQDPQPHRACLRREEPQGIHRQAARHGERP